MSRAERKTKSVWSVLSQAPIDPMRLIKQLKVQPILDFDSTNTIYIEWADLVDEIGFWGNDWCWIKEKLGSSDMVQHAVRRAEEEVQNLRSSLIEEEWMQDQRLVGEAELVVRPCQECEVGKRLALSGSCDQDLVVVRPGTRCEHVTDEQGAPDVAPNIYGTEHEQIEGRGTNSEENQENMRMAGSINKGLSPDENQQDAQQARKESSLENAFKRL